MTKKQKILPRNHYLPWTVREFQYVEKHYHSRPVGKIASELGRSVGSVRRIAALLGCSGNSWSDDEKCFLRKHYGRKPTRNIAAVLGRSESAVRMMVNKLNLARGQNHPWTEAEMAILTEHYRAGAGLAHVQTLLPGRTRDAITVQASKMKLTGRRPWTEDEDRILIEFYPALGSGMAEKLPHRTLPAIRHRAKSLGLTVDKRKPL